MSETKKAGVVTRLARVMDGVCAHKELRQTAIEAIAPFWRGGIEVALTELDRRLLGDLDLVASWPPELRAVVPLVEALTPEGKALLPDVLRAMAEHPGDCAVLEAGLGDPVSTSAKVAAWAGKLRDEDRELLAQALVTAMGAYRERGQPGLADRLLGMWEELGTAMEDVPLDANAAHILASRTLPADPEPRVWKAGTVPPVVLPEMVMMHDGVETRLLAPENWARGIMWSCEKNGARWWVRQEELAVSKLAEDFPVPEDA